MVLWRDLAPGQAPVKVNRKTLRIRYFVAFSTANRPPSRIVSATSDRFEHGPILAGKPGAIRIPAYRQRPSLTSG
jgi:hypothetical protein